MCENCPSKSALHLLFLCPNGVEIWSTLAKQTGYRLMVPASTVEGISAKSRDMLQPMASLHLRSGNRCLLRRVGTYGKEEMTRCLRHIYFRLESYCERQCMRRECGCGIAILKLLITLCQRRQTRMHEIQFGYGLMHDSADRHMLFCFTRKFLTIEVDVMCFRQM